MIVRSNLPWREVDDFRRYRPEVLACLRAHAGSVRLAVDRSSSPYAWSLTTTEGAIPLLASESGLRRYFDDQADSTESVVLAGHSTAVPVRTVWARLSSALLETEAARFQRAVCQAADWMRNAPAEPAAAARPEALGLAAQAALRTLCFESPLNMCVELSDVATELIVHGYACLDFRGRLTARDAWEFEPGQRKLERLRQEFAA